MESFQENGLLLPGIGFGTAAILGLPGMLLAALRRPKARWIIAAVGLHMASLMTVFVTERYRLAAVPGLLLLGGFGLVELWREIAAGTLLRRSHRAAAAGYALVLAVAVVVTHRPVDLAVRHINDYNGALADIDNHRLDRAQGKLTRVLADNPNNAETYFALGNVALERGDRDRAKYYYRRTLQLDPAHFRVLNNLGLLALEEKRWPLAEAFLGHALNIEPDDAKAQYLLAVARWERADLPGAHTAIAEARRLDPADTHFRQLAEQLDAGRGAPPSLDSLFSLP
jgi:Flp pilus assembly protein TadD